MKYLIAVAVLTMAVAGCSADPPDAPVSGDVKDHSKSQPFIGDGASLPPGLFPPPLIGTPLIGSGAAAQGDRYPRMTHINVTLIEMSFTNRECLPYLPAKTWQDLMLPPVPNKEC